MIDMKYIGFDDTDNMIDKWVFGRIYDAKLFEKYDVVLKKL